MKRTFKVELEVVIDDVEMEDLKEQGKDLSDYHDDTIDYIEQEIGWARGSFEGFTITGIKERK